MVPTDPDDTAGTSVDVVYNGVVSADATNVLGTCDPRGEPLITHSSCLNGWVAFE